MEFEYKEGLCMSNLILADEINRTSPKTQASLLEVMEEYQITVDNITYNLPRPFMVLATQNPVNYIGTYPLPEAQIDRFFMKISLGYPSTENEVEILMSHRKDNPLNTLESVATGDDIMKLQDGVDNVAADEAVAEYVTRITKATREHEDIILGVSPRGSLALLRAACGNAFLNNRDYVIPDDVKKMALPVLSHRLVLTQDAKLRKVKPETIIKVILDKVTVFDKKKTI
jgi:MoxR-like ATPase